MTPSAFRLAQKSVTKKEIRSIAYNSESDFIMWVEGATIAIVTSTCIHGCVTERVSISGCSDGEYGYVISEDNFVRKFELSNGITLGEWPVPANSPYHHQMTVINGKIYYCNVTNNEIIIFSACKESATKASIMSLGMLERPAYIVDNTKHQKETVIISGASGVGKFPIIHGISEPEWFTPIEHARGTCLDFRGMIYMGTSPPSAICMLAQGTGR